MAISAKEIMNEIASHSEYLHVVDGEEKCQLQRTLVGMMEDIHRMCVDNHIRYSLFGGSALGAYRHQGFIPWDDDIDIVMPRREWERFKALFEKNLGGDYILEAPNYGNKDTKTTWGKVYKRGSELVEIQDLNTPFCNGIFVDVFILENVSDNIFIRNVDAKLSDFLKGVATSQLYYLYPNDLLWKFYGASKESLRYFKMRRFLGFLFSWISHKRFCELYDRFVSRHSDDLPLWTVPTSRNNYKGETMPKSWFDPLKLMKFEDKEFYVFNNITEYLEHMYGKNYMQLPPEEKRERHFCVRIKF